MKIVMLEAVAGGADPDRGLLEDFSFKPGDLLELDDAQAQAWIASGRAVATPELTHRKVSDRKAKAEADRLRAEFQKEAAELEAKRLQEAAEYVPTLDEYVAAGYDPAMYDFFVASRAPFVAAQAAEKGE